MCGGVPFQFGDRGAAQAAFEKFQEGTVWEITQPQFDQRAKSEYIGAPVKQVLLMQAPTKLRPIPPVEQLDHPPAHHLDPAPRLADVIGIQAIRGPALGSTRMDFSAKVLSISEIRSVRSGAKQLTVRDVELVDDSVTADNKGAKCTLAAWDGAAQLFDGIAVGSGAGTTTSVPVHAVASHVLVKLPIPALPQNMAKGPDA